jgi:hypothetical protein
MNCKTLINKDEFIENFTLKWVFGKYMKYRNKLLFQKQKHLLNSTKGDADFNKKENLIIEKRSVLLKKRKQINKELNDLKAELIQLRRSSVGGERGEGDDGDLDINIRRSDVSINIRCSFECGGFLDESYKCMNCSKYTCKRCYSNIEDQHMCSNYAVNVYNISKPCPQCGEFISRDGGCNTINCTNCNIVFNWNSGNIIKEIVYKDIVYKHLPNFNELNTQSLNNDDIIILRGMYEHIIEFIRLNMINFVKILSNDNINKFKKIRINYLIDKINESEFYKEIIKVSKYENYRLYIINIILSSYNKGLSIFNNINDESINELNKIIINTNNKILNITKYFKYSNNIKIHHWFNLNDINFLLKS